MVCWECSKKASAQSLSAWSSWYLGWVVVVHATLITCHGIELWPYSVSMLVKWVAFLGTLHWPQSRLDLGVAVFYLWRCSFRMSSWLVKGSIWRRQFTGAAGQAAQFQCRLFLLVQALIFGDLAGTLVLFSRALVALS